ncbi:MAG: MarR family transcriptional regulator [Desulfomonile tiedjei]|nr:MarR family transcriptional regulator [Desulfomonile tiedjei]
MSDVVYKSDMSIDERVLMAMVRIAEGFKKNTSALLNRWGLTFSQYNVLRILDACESGQNTMRNVNRIMLVSSANLTGIAKRLERNGFIVRKSDPNDDRIKRLQITPAGTKVLKAIYEHKEQNLKRYLMKYSNEEKSDLLETLLDISKQTRRKSQPK